MPLLYLGCGILAPSPTFARGGDAWRGRDGEDAAGPFPGGPFDQGDRQGSGRVGGDGPEGLCRDRRSSFPFAHADAPPYRQRRALVGRSDRPRVGCPVCCNCDSVKIIVSSDLNQIDQAAIARLSAAIASRESGEIRSPSMNI